MRKATLEKSKAEDDKLKEQVVTYISFDDLTDFEEGH